MPFERPSKSSITIFFFISIIFILIVAYLNTQRARLSYHLDILGTDPSLGRALVRVVSRDGYLAPGAEILLDGKVAGSHLIRYSPKLREIELRVGSYFHRYSVTPADFSLAGRGSQIDGFSEKELENGMKAWNLSRIGNKRIYLLPETFRMVAEYDTPVTLFCFEDDLPCSESTVSIAGRSVDLKRGVARFSMKLPLEKGVIVGFDETGESGPVPFPYIGKMLLIKEVDDGLALYALSDDNPVYVDCFRRGVWKFSHLLISGIRGGVLPESYEKCDRIQASFNPADPGTIRFVYSKERPNASVVSDPYYQPLVGMIERFHPDMMNHFMKQYSAAYFRKLRPLFSHNNYEADFERGKNDKLNFLFGIISLVLSLFFVYFIAFISKRINVVVDEDGEYLTLNPTQRMLVIFGLCSAVLSSMLLLLYLLRNLG